MSGDGLQRRAIITRGTIEVSSATTERLDRPLRPLGYQVTSLPTRLGTAAQAAEQVSAFLVWDVVTARCVWSCNWLLPWRQPIRPCAWHWR